MWVARTAHATGMPRPAARAYGRASIVVSREQPDCHVGWPTIAGIGSVESDHGRHDGARLRADGRPWPRIVGPALDGTNGTEAIPASADSEFFHGDDDWDHAVGPMQFIPSTWESSGVDGDGDGDADPQNVYDAAASAAGYLCADGRDMADAGGRRAAILSYNQSDEYVRTVIGWQTYFATYGIEAIGQTAGYVPNAPADDAPTTRDEERPTTSPRCPNHAAKRPATGTTMKPKPTSATMPATTSAICATIIVAARPGRACPTSNR